jgi:hypothetical protein
MIEVHRLELRRNAAIRRRVSFANGTRPVKRASRRKLRQTANNLAQDLASDAFCVSLRTMEGDRTDRALARIEAALTRIEGAARAPRTADGSEIAELQDRHDRLRAAVTHSLGELDALIEEAGG